MDAEKAQTELSRQACLEKNSHEGTLVFSVPSVEAALMNKIYLSLSLNNTQPVVLSYINPRHVLLGYVHSCLSQRRTHLKIDHRLSKSNND